MMYRALLFLSLMCLLSCVERQPVAQNAPVRPAPVRTAASSSAAKTPGAFTYIVNPMKGLSANLGISESVSERIMDIRASYVNQMVDLKLPSGKFDLEKCTPIIERMDREIKNLLGEEKHVLYTQYTRWVNAERLKRR